MKNETNIILLAESGSDIPKELCEQYGIEIVPMHVSLGEETLDDGSFPVEDICSFYDKTGMLPKTSGCSPQDFEDVFDRLHEKWPDKHILHMAYSAITTCSYQSAVIAAEDRDYVTSIDTKHVSAGQAMAVVSVAQMLEENPDMSIEDVVAESEKICKRVKMSFLPANLEYLKAGGRVSNAVYIGGKLLRIHPAIVIDDGHLIAKKKYRGNMMKVTELFLRDYLEAEKPKKDRLWLIRAIGLPEDIQKRMEEIASEMGYKNLFWIQTGCVITTHGGPGAFGVVGMSE